MTHGKPGSIRWDNGLIRQLCEVTGESKVSLQATIKHLAEALEFELPRWVGGATK